MRLPTVLATLAALLLLGFGSVASAKELKDGMMSTDTITVNVNEADAATMANVLVGIGFSRAQAIVEYRDQHGPFYNAEELTAVKGIGQSTIEKNLSRITLK